MNCTICGKPTMPGAMLCVPCKAALKRARYVTVQEDMRRPSIIDVRRPPRRRGPRPPEASIMQGHAPEPVALPDIPPPAAGFSNRALARRIYAGVFVVAVALGGASYFGQRALGAHAEREPAAAPAIPADEPQVDAAAVAAKPPPAAVVAAPSPPVTISEAAEPDAEAPVPAAAKPAAAPSGKRGVRSGASVATVNGDPPDAWNPPPEPEKVAVAPPPPPPAPAPDRWQTMRDSIALCDRENVINSIICGQKARIQYCEGYWGKVPQCPGPTVNPER